MVKVMWRAAVVAALAIRGSGALAASTTLTTTNHYYYTVPSSTNIVGRVMGEIPDYRLIRYEDVAWINEAWAERIALGENRMPVSSALPEGMLIGGRTETNGVATTAYWTNATMRTTAVTNAWIENLMAQETLERILYKASGGATTNAKRRILAPRWRGLVTREAVTNAFRMLRGMNVVVKPCNTAGNTNWLEVAESQWEAKLNGEQEYQGSETVTNAVAGAGWHMEAGGVNQVNRYMRWDSEEEEWITSSWGQGTESWEERPTGKVRIEAQFTVRSTNDWMRGEGTPKVVEAVRAYGVVYEEGGRREEGWERRFWSRGLEEAGWEVVATNSVSEETKATVLMDLGEASWKGVRENALAYEVEVDVPEMMAECAAATEGMPTPAEIEAANAVPEFGLREDNEGKVEKYVWLACEIKKIYLVIKLRPITSLEGW